MTNLQDSATLLARILLSTMFIVAALGKLGNVAGFSAYMASAGVPEALAWPVILFEIGFGLALLVGWQTRPVAIALGGFSVLTALMYHLVPSDQMQMTIFFKNLALGGGYLSLALLGAGRFSLDARRHRTGGALV